MFGDDIAVPEQVHPGHHWDEVFDVVVVGGSLAGLTTAVHSAGAGQTVVVLEKAPIVGGTARKAVGGMWVPMNRFMRDAGVFDDVDGAVAYIARLSRPALFDREHPTLGLPAWEHQHLQSFCQNADAAFQALERTGIAVQQDPSFPDYHGHLPDVSAPMGRQLFPERADGSRGDGASFVSDLGAVARERGVSTRLEHRAVGVLLDGDAVVGLRVRTAEGELHIGARRGVCFGSGGFTHNAEMRDAYLGGHVLGGCAALTNEGDFQLIARGLGIPLYQMDLAWMAPMVLERSLNRDSEMMGIFAVPGDSLMIVNTEGHRIGNEKAPYHDRVRAMHVWDAHDARYPNFYQLAVWDQRAADRFSGTFLGNFIPPVDSPLQATVLRGDTVDELATALDERLSSLGRRVHGVRLAADFPVTLRKSIDRFNEFAVRGVDKDFRRGETPIEVTFHGPVADDNHLPNGTMYPLAEDGPYYATILGPGTLDTKGGPRTDTACRVLDAQDRPVPGLYALGNAAAAPTGHAYPSGGMTFGPIITSAWLAAKALTAESARSAFRDQEAAGHPAVDQGRIPAER